MGILGLYQQKKKKEEHSTTTAEGESELLSEMLNEIRNRMAVVVTDAAIDRDYIATHQVISIRNNETEVIGEIASARWSDGLIPAGKGIGLLALVTHIVKNMSEMQSGEIYI